MDIFDCVLPTRNGRNGAFFTDSGLLTIRNARFAADKDPISQSCQCLTCQSYSRAYLHHLFKCKEILGCRLATLHNLHYYLNLMQRMRNALSTENFNEFYMHESPKLKKAYPGRTERVASPFRERDFNENIFSVPF